MISGGLLALIGLAILGIGAYTFVVGVHGGPFVAGGMVLFGAVLFFLSLFLVRAWFRPAPPPHRVPEDLSK